MFLKYDEIPGSHTLFLDYVYNYDRVKDFYDINFRDLEQFEHRIKKLADVPRLNEEMSQIVKKQYQGLKPSAETTENIALLGSQNTLAVVTGQQLGIFGGPLYTIYKIITAIKLSAMLNKDYKQFNFVPIFWLEGDDHDFDEIRSINLIDENNELKKISYGNESPEEENYGSVGRIKINETINEFFLRTEEFLKTTEFTPVIMDKLKGFYAPGKTFGAAFRELLFWLFDKYGLLIFDPTDRKVKQLLIPVFKKEISDFRRHSETVVKVSARLEESYHAQVKVQAVNLFHSYDEGRYLIEPVENEFRLKRKRKKFTFDELNDLIEKEPDSFSPGVLLRPVCQDYLLPTAVYVAGPSETAYFSQALPLYEFHNITPPIIYPRASATLLEKNIAGIVDKFQLSIPGIFKDTEAVKRTILNGLSEQNVQELFSEAEMNISAAFGRLKGGLDALDKTIGDSSIKYYEKTISYLNELKSKTGQANEKKHETTVRQLEKAFLNIYPHQNLQERELNLIYYLNKYGLSILDKLIDELDIEKFEHQVVRL